ncbi:MAG: peptide chain release factor 2, partial [Limisphaerales bacterium]
MLIFASAITKTPILSADHTQLQQQLSNLKKYLQIEQKLHRLNEDEAITTQPGFWDDPKKAELVMKEIKVNKNWVGIFDKAQSALDDYQVLLEFLTSGDATSEEVEESRVVAEDLIVDLELKSTLNGEEDGLNAILQINSGAGGTESCDWADMLLRMYRMYAEKKGYSVKELDYQAGDVAGIKSAVIEISAKHEGNFVYGHLKGENGVHRLVRISPFDSNAKRHTSFASVFVYPVVDDTIVIEVNPAH